jgi:quinol monooxygenase YgiN
VHALLATADVEPGHEEEGLAYLQEILPQLQEVPGLLSGYWLATTRDGESLAIVLFENEASAQSVAQMGLKDAPQPPGATFRSAEVREVIAHI